MAGTMRALVLRQHGDLDQLKLEADYPRRRPAEGHVVIRVGASSFNYHDVFTVKGMPGIKVPMPVIIGLDMAGTIAEVGPGVTGWTPGQRVHGQPHQPEEGADGRDAGWRHGGILPGRRRPADRHPRRRQLRAGGVACRSPTARRTA